MNPKFFTDAAEFRSWLADNHDKREDLLVGYYKVASGRPSMTWPESVDQALCFGWIDGVRRRIDDESYCIRFTPRKSGSIWSAVNIEKAENLIAIGSMQPAGLEAFNRRSDERSRIYAYENTAEDLPPDLESTFRKDLKAWEYFIAQAPSYRRTVIHQINRAKQQETRLDRLHRLIAASSKGERLQ